MFLTVIAFLLAAASLGMIIHILWRHWKDLRLLNPRSIKEEAEREKRETVIRQRFERIQHDQIQPLRRIARRLGKAVTRTYARGVEHLHALEKAYHTVTRPLSSMAPSGRERIKSLLDEGRALMRDLKWADAERRFLEILSLDARHTDAFKGLGHIYLKQKLYPQAKETYEFLLKIKQEDDMVYAGLAEIAEAEDDLTTAERMRLKAVELRPRLAQRQAELAEFYLARSQPEKAKAPAKQAHDLEVKSLKYLELTLEVAVMSGATKEAEKLYDRFRLKSDNRQKVQMWKEKVEGMKEQSVDATTNA